MSREMKNQFVCAQWSVFLRIRQNFPLLPRPPPPDLLWLLLRLLLPDLLRLTLPPLLRLDSF